MIWCENYYNPRLTFLRCPLEVPTKATLWGPTITPITAVKVALVKVMADWPMIGTDPFNFNVSLQKLTTLTPYRTCWSVGSGHEREVNMNIREKRDGNWCYHLIYMCSIYGLKIGSNSNQILMMMNKSKKEKKQDLTEDEKFRLMLSW